ncbi:MAG TPA: hypothetical protein VFP50_04145, partial [Anaeromyxobacteraceae bacterium]|nr:hypothetical protein [Anaeromyxobacteraceae bacterium]
MALPRALAPTLAAALLAALAAAAFAPAVGNGFTGLDDDVRLVENAHLRGGDAEPLRWAFSAEAGRLYVQPLTWLAFAGEAAAFGLDPGAFHAVSVALHALAAALLLLLLWRLTGALGRSAAAATIFALHPLAVEPVAWAAEQNTLLAAVSGLAAAHAHAWHARAPSAGRWLLVAAAFAASLLAKPWLLGLPLVLLVLDVTWLGRLPPAGSPGRAAAARRLLLEKLPLLALGVAWALHARLAMQGDPALQLAPEPERPLALRLAHAPVALARTLGKLVAPVDLSVHDPFPASVPAWQVLGALALIAGITALALAWQRRAPALLAGWGCVILLLAPTLGLVQAGRWPAIADRFAYLAIAAAAAGLAFAVPAELLAGRAQRWIAGAGVAVLASLLLLVTRAQLEPWRD